MADAFDVIVVGGRCAGSPLATLLAREGLRVALIEQADFPKDTLSTHIFQAPAINFLRRLGVLEEVRHTGARGCTTVDLRQEGFHGRIAVNRRPGDDGAFMSVRRFMLDPILLDAAVRAGAEVQMSTKVVDLIRDEGRVVGVRTRSQGKDGSLRAKLVVGADGRNSTVGALVGSRKYNVIPGERFGYWWFFANADPGADPPVVYHRWDGRFVVGMPTDAGLYQVILLPDMSFLSEFREDREAAFMRHARACPPVAAALQDAHPVGRMFGLLRFEGFFRESTGSGWALVGDAGHFKDPAPGQGISDAFRQVEALAPVLVRAIHAKRRSLDADLAAWGHWRDRDAAEHYWLAADFGAAGQAPAVVVEVTRLLHSAGRTAELADVFLHRVKPSAVFTPRLVLRATASALRRPGADRREVLREVRELIMTDGRRRRLNRRPRFVALERHSDAGKTEMTDQVAA